MKQISYILLLVLLVTACNKTTKEPKKALAFTAKEYQVRSTAKPESTLEADIPIASGEETTAKNINDKIFATIKSIIGQEGDTSEDYNALFSGFISNYEQFIKENPDHAVEWTATVKGNVEYFNSTILNVKLDSYIMTGGAHGNSNMTSLLFDPTNGNELSIKDIIKDTTAFSQLAEKKFREKYNIAAEKPINSTGLMFPDDKFILPQSIFVIKDGLLLYYNPYEIAAYAEGSKEVLIPYGEIKDYISFSF